MTPLAYSIVIEQTDDPQFWGYYSPDLLGYTGTAVSYLEAVTNAIEGIPEYLEFMREVGSPIPPPNPHASITFPPPEAPQEVGSSISHPS